MLLPIEKFADYEIAAALTDRSPHTLTYYALGLSGESGEFADKVKKVLRDDGGALTNAARIALLRELGDLLWYMARAANCLGASLEEIAAENLKKLADRQARGVLGGSGDER